MKNVIDVIDKKMEKTIDGWNVVGQVKDSLRDPKEGSYTIRYKGNFTKVLSKEVSFNLEDPSSLSSIINIEDFDCIRMSTRTIYNYK